MVFKVYKALWGMVAENSHGKEKNSLARSIATPDQAAQVFNKQI